MNFRMRSLFYPRSTPNGSVPDAPLDCTTQLILFEAENAGMKWRLFDDSDVIELTHGQKKNYFRNRGPFTIHTIGSKICHNKAASRTFLRENAIQVTKGFPIHRQDDPDEVDKVWESLQKPVVLKPTHGTHGDLVFLNIMDKTEFDSVVHAFFANQYQEGALLAEEMFFGTEYRIMVTREKVIAILERIPAFVTGTGSETITELIELKNKLPIRNISEDLYPHIKIDDDLKRTLRRKDIDVDYIPKENEKVSLREVSNVMAGGETIDRTVEAHSSVSDIALKIINAIPGLYWCGIDFMTTDLYSLQSDSTYRIIEINGAPEFDMHDIPMQGQPRGVAKEFLKQLFPNSEL